MREVEINDLKKITELVKEKYDYDFTNYAMSSFKRRIVRVLDLYHFGIDKLIEKIEKE